MLIQHAWYTGTLVRYQRVPGAVGLYLDDKGYVVLFRTASGLVTLTAGSYKVFVTAGRRISGILHKPNDSSTRSTVARMEAGTAAACNLDLPAYSRERFKRPLRVNVIHPDLGLGSFRSANC